MSAVCPAVISRVTGPAALSLTIAVRMRTFRLHLARRLSYRKQIACQQILAGVRGRDPKAAEGGLGWGKTTGVQGRSPGRGSGVRSPQKLKNF